MIKRIIEKSLQGDLLTEKEIRSLFNVPLYSKESLLLLWAARKKSMQASKEISEVHAQIGLNIAPCPKNCQFCSFAAENKVFKDSYELPVDEAILQAKEFEADQANAIYLMTTANFPFERFIQTAQEIRHALKPTTVLIANIGDFTAEQAQELKQVGFSGIYHAVRLGEGTETKIPVEKRLATMTHAREAGLGIGTCLEPVGPEHCLDELVEKTIITRDIQPVFSGAARRIPIPHTPLGSHGIVSEAAMAQILAVVRLALGHEVPGNCTHEPNVIGAFSGANLLWAEVGSNPRDTIEKTERKRGMSVSDCINIFHEAGWKVHMGPSTFYSG